MKDETTAVPWDKRTRYYSSVVHGTISDRRVVTTWRIHAAPGSGLMVTRDDGESSIKMRTYAGGGIWRGHANCESAEQLRFVAAELMKIADEIEEGKEQRK